MRQASEWSGRPGTLEIREVPCSPPGVLADATRRRELTGPCRTRFEDSFRSLYDTMAAGDAMNKRPRPVSRPERWAWVGTAPRGR